MNTEANRFQIAYLTISDTTTIVVFVDAGFEANTTAQRRRVYTAFQEFLWRTNPAIDIVLVWQDSEGRTRFIAPVQQQRFFQIMKYDQLYAQADGSITLTLG